MKKSSKKIVTKILILSLSLFLFNCGKGLAAYLLLAKALQKTVEEDKNKKEEKEEKKEKKSYHFFPKSSHTLSMDISSLTTVSLSNDLEIETFTLNELEGKYISPRILLKDWNEKDKLEITSNNDVVFEIYKGLSSLTTKRDKETRFQNFLGRKDFKFLKNSVGYEIEALSSQGNYTVLLLSTSQITVKVKRNNFKSKFVVEPPTKIMEITTEVQTVPMPLYKKYEAFDGSLVKVYRTPQLVYNIKKGDRIVNDVKGKYGLGAVGLFSITYKGGHLLKDTEDIRNRKLEKESVFTEDYFNPAPGYVALKNGIYSNMYTLYEGLEPPSLKIVKITPNVPDIDSPMIAINDTFQEIEYTLDKRNELYSAWISNQFTLTGAKKGMKLLVFSEKKEKRFHLPAFSFYRGTEKLTEENINDRFLHRYEIMTDNPIVFDGKYQIRKAGDYSIIFNNYNETKLLHKIKLEDE